jgi:hypothetical protein
MVGAPALAPCVAAHKGFIDFDRMLRPNSVAFRPDHARAEFVENLESGLVAIESELPLKLHRRLAGRLCCHEVSAPEPGRQRRVTALHDRASHERDIGLAGAAPQDNRTSLGKAVRLIDVCAFHTCKSVRPPQVLKVFCAGRVIWKDQLKLWERRWEATRVHVRNLASNHCFGNQPDRQVCS